jgi:hypothetical protein
MDQQRLGCERGIFGADSGRGLRPSVAVGIVHAFAGENHGK